MSVTIYHNPRCSKSRQTLALIEEKGITPEVVLYLETPPSKEALGDILKQLDKKPEELMRKGEQEYKDHIKGQDLSAQQQIEKMVAYPKMIERPIVVCNGQARVGRPPESVLEIL
ncbi:arsenate reductase (glutaredoxin) [Endozoicomonas numazuensis]|uniref:Arsenate reductase n=1 Tax=Endozoicomonas numazuensis TaxID=1137799 RepID=A0A081NE51_9GAMM|nr:arsenate reductase (glutaredoxin) [Endozoicomonas numazuensis]KEQ16724.1 arsenate reductase [Endozoicomonas numazuensis]